MMPKPDHENKRPFVSIIIPHYGDSQILYDCLDILNKNTFYKPFQVVIVDNGSDLDEDKARRLCSQIRIIKTEKNLGFAGGCNAGIKDSRGEYVVLLNNDTKVGVGWLRPLVEHAEKEPRVAAVQPKLTSLSLPGFYDYAGGCGGLLDIFGYPFAIGRLFESLEKDQNQYQGVSRIFWASGTACLLRRSILNEVGWLDELFFAHMEEIDLNWRFHLAGYDVHGITQSSVQHWGAKTLKATSWRKMYLNHRNNLMMLLKNLSLFNLIIIFPIRIFLELFTAIYFTLKGQWRRPAAVVAALGSLIVNSPYIFKQRKTTQRIRRISDRKLFANVYKGSIVWMHFIRRKTKVSQMPGVIQWM